MPGRSGHTPLLAFKFGTDAPTLKPKTKPLLFQNKRAKPMLRPWPDFSTGRGSAFARILDRLDQFPLAHDAAIKLGADDEGGRSAEIESLALIHVALQNGIDALCIGLVGGFELGGFEPALLSAALTCSGVRRPGVAISASMALT